jgi:hypothetical protein
MSVFDGVFSHTGIIVAVTQAVNMVAFLAPQWIRRALFTKACHLQGKYKKGNETEIW